MPISYFTLNYVIVDVKSSMNRFGNTFAFPFLSVHSVHLSQFSSTSCLFDIVVQYKIILKYQFSL